MRDAHHASLFTFHASRFTHHTSRFTFSHRPLEPTFDVPQTHPHHDWAAVGARHWILRLHKLVDQPLHLLRRERHVHFDRRLASKLRGNPVTYALQCGAAALALDNSKHLSYNRK